MGDQAQTTFTNEDGNFRFYLKLGEEVTIQPLAQECFELTTSPPLYEMVVNEDAVNGLDFGFMTVGGNEAVDLQINSARPRCGFTIPYWLTVVNTGCEPVQTFVELQIPDNVTYSWSNIEPAEITDIVFAGRLKKYLSMLLSVS